MVAFADRTALGSAKAMASLMYSRVDGAGEAKEMVAVLGGLQGAGDAHAAMRELVLAAQKNVTAAAPGNSGHMLAERRLAALRTFAMPVAEHPEALAPAAKLWQARYEILNEHSALRPVETGVVREEEEK
jgi:NAD(P)H-hydrate repair Nnr-like enzyme with NAD(P)H-hydrate epimerase domain